VREAEGREHFFAHEVRVAASGLARDHVVENAVTEIRVLIVFARRRDQVGVTEDGLIHRRAAVGLVLVEELVVERQSGGVVGDAAQGGGSGVAGAGADLGGAEIVVGGLVEVDAAAFGEDHESGGGDGLGDGGKRIEGVVRGGCPVLAVRPAEPFFPDDLAVAGQSKGDGGCAGFGELALDGGTELVELAAVGGEDGEEQEDGTEQHMETMLQQRAETRRCYNEEVFPHAVFRLSCLRPLRPHQASW